MLAGFPPKLAAMLTQPVGQAITAGLLTGVIGGSVGVATGAIPVVDPPAGNRTALLACPGVGPVVTSLSPGTDVLVTARSADGRWLEIYVGEPGVERAWAPVSVLQLEAAPGSLPVGDCVAPATKAPSAPPESAAASESAPPSVGPSPSSSPTPSATPRPTRTPTPTAGPSAETSASPAPLTGPILAGLVLQDVPIHPYDDVYYIYRPDCLGEYRSAPFVLTASDADGVASVTLSYQPTGGSSGSVVMDWEGEDLWYGAIDSQAAWADGPIEYWFQGEDDLGNKGPILYPPSDLILELASC